MTATKETQEGVMMKNAKLREMRDAIWKKMRLYIPESEGFIISSVIYDNLWDREDLIKYVNSKKDVMDISIKKVRKLIARYGEGDVIKFDTALYDKYPCLKDVNFKTVGDATRLILSYNGEEEPDGDSDNEYELTYYENKKLRKKAKDIEKGVKQFTEMLPDLTDLRYNDLEDAKLTALDVYSEARDAYVTAICKVAKQAGYEIRGISIKYRECGYPTKYKFKKGKK